MIDNLHEECAKTDKKWAAKKLEYNLAKNKVRTYAGKKALENLNNYWDYTPGMFSHLK